MFPMFSLNIWKWFNGFQPWSFNMFTIIYYLFCEFIINYAISIAGIEEQITFCVASNNFHNLRFNYSFSRWVHILPIAMKTWLGLRVQSSPHYFVSLCLIYCIVVISRKLIMWVILLIIINEIYALMIWILCIFYDFQNFLFYYFAMCFCWSFVFFSNTFVTWYSCSRWVHILSIEMKTWLGLRVQSSPQFLHWPLDSRLEVFPFLFCGRACASQNHLNCWFPFVHFVFFDENCCWLLCPIFFVYCNG